jgi:nicotinate-nucleotide pyrophosphorylase (carboxylating)
MIAFDEIIMRHIETALSEDIGAGDITTLATIGTEPIRFAIIAKSDGVLSGLPVADAVFHTLDETIEAVHKIEDGQDFNKGDCIVEYFGNGAAILTGERTALNYLGHLSGIASLTARFVEKVKGTGVKILDTRKTTPGLRYLEKYAVTCGGGVNHRFGLYDMVLIKDNHISASGSVSGAIDKVLDLAASGDFENSFGFPPDELIIEVEIENENQLREAIGRGISRLLLDNRSVEQLQSMVKTARSLADDIELEASGNVTIETVRQIAECGVDYISIGALTHSAPSSDFSLKVIS